LPLSVQVSARRWPDDPLKSLGDRIEGIPNVSSKGQRIRRLLALNLMKFLSVGMGSGVGAAAIRLALVEPLFAVTTGLSALERRPTGQHSFDQIPPQPRDGRHSPRRPYVNQPTDLHSAETTLTDGIGWGVGTAARMPRFCVAVCQGWHPARRPWKRQTKRFESR